jgi:hypothetical protein
MKAPSASRHLGARSRGDASGRATEEEAASSSGGGGVLCQRWAAPSSARAGGSGRSRWLDLDLVIVGIWGRLGMTGGVHLHREREKD